MPVTLAEAKELSQDKLTDIVIDEFVKSPLLAVLPFDNTIKPNGKSLTYTYNRTTTQPTAGSRALNTEYSPQEAKTSRQSVDLKVMGGAYEIDRVIAEDETQVVNEVEFQSAEKSKATIASFNDQLINGDTAVKASDFDGINKAVTGSSTDVTPAAAIDLSTAANIAANAKEFLYQVRKMIGRMDARPTHLLMSSDMYTAFQSVADYAPSVKVAKDELGNEVLRYGVTTLVEMGEKPGTADPIIATDGATGTTSMYAVRLDMDGVHGVSPDGDKIVRIYAPNMKSTGAVKKGEVELVGAIAIKKTKSVAALRNIKIQ